MKQDGSDFESDCHLAFYHLIKKQKKAISTEVEIAL